MDDPGPRFPDVYPRLAYRDEQAALDYLVRVFRFEEVREARRDVGGHILAWLTMGEGMIMISRENADVHRIMSPAGGQASVQILVRIHDIDRHYAHAVAAGADVTMALEDAFFGERRYEVTDPEGHRFAFHEPLSAVRARGGEPLGDGWPDRA